MSDAPASILPRKIENSGPARPKSGFTPDMLRTFCDMAGDALGDLLQARTKIDLDSVGLEPMEDVAPREGDVLCGAVIDLNGIPRAVTFTPDTDALFHIVDIMLGADASQGEPVIARAPSPLGDKFCKIATETIMRAFSDACDAGIGPGACILGGQIDVVHDPEMMVIAEPKADIMAITMTVAFGKADRKGRFTMHIPLQTVDAISSVSPGGTARPAYQSGPWFDHMKASVAIIELDTLALLKTEAMTLAGLSRLDIGDVIALDMDAVTSVTLALEDGGDVVATGELGTSSGKRVINLDGPPSKAFLDPIRDLLDES